MTDLMMFVNDWFNEFAIVCNAVCLTASAIVFNAICIRVRVMNALRLIVDALFT